VTQDIGFKLDPRAKEPLHRQIFDEVVARISAQAFPPGFKLPPTRVLASELATHRNTVARAYAALEQAGFVASSVGRGTFVLVHAPAAATPTSHSRTTPLRPGLPWSSLLSNAARGDAVSRAQRQARHSESKDLINLARMQPSADMIPADLLRRCLAHVTAQHGARAFMYAPPEGLRRLREQLAHDLESRGVPARPDEILITSGSQQALDLVARALINPGDTVLVESTTYAGAIDLFSLAGARLCAVPGDGQGPELAALERLARPDVKALYLMPDAHNPTGQTIPLERRRALVAWSRAAGIPIIEDDYAAGLALDEHDPPAALRALDGDVIHISTLSKRLAPALRIGYLIAPTNLWPALVAMKKVVDLSSSLLLQHAVAEFLERGYLRPHTERVRREYRVRRDALHAALRGAMPEGVQWRVPSHGQVLWLTLPARLDPNAVYEEAGRRGVLVTPSSLWSVASPPTAAVRLSFCAEPPDRLALGARRLGKALKHLLAEAAPAPRADTTLEMV
jgi:2-aminoadipate transaminase